jgi:Domain of unknown function (DUF5668)/B-box zinc finger
MNCATHNNVAAVAFCRTCGKPLCNQCTRDVRGVIYCESCLAARMEGAAPAGAYSAPTYTPPQNPYQTVGDPSLGLRIPQPQPTGPNPTVAGILSGFFPFGVGAVYCGQYAKGLAHLVIMVLLIVLETSDIPWFMHMFLGLGIGFFYFYQIIDSVRTARAIQLGEPVPDPFGLVAMFGGGGTGPHSSGGAGLGAPIPHGEPTKIPVAAAVLIGLGVLFLLSTTFDFSFHRFWSLILVILGVYLFAKNWGLLGSYRPMCVCERCRTRKLMGPAILVTLGILFLLDNASDISFGKTWPALLLVIGVVKLVQSNASYAGHVGPFPPGPTNFPPTPPTPPPPGFSDPPQGPPQSSSASSAGPSTDPSSGEVKNV